jgi:Mn-containing catalase
LSTIQPNFPPGVLQTDPKYTNTYYNMSSGPTVRGPWNEGLSSQLKEEWQYVENPLQVVIETEGLTKVEPVGTERTEESVKAADKALGKLRAEEINSALPKGATQWSDY